MWRTLHSFREQAEERNSAKDREQGKQSAAGEQPENFKTERVAKNLGNYGHIKEDRGKEMPKLDISRSWKVGRASKVTLPSDLALNKDVT